MSAHMTTECGTEYIRDIFGKPGVDVEFSKLEEVL